MMGLSGPLTRVDMRRAPFRWEEVCPGSGVPGPSAKGGLYGALFTGLTRALTANRPARHSPARAPPPPQDAPSYRRERRPPRAVGAHRGRSEENGKHKGLCKESRTLIAVKTALRPDQHGHRTRTDARERLDRRGVRRDLVGKDQEPALVPIFNDPGELRRFHYLGHV